MMEHRILCASKNIEDYQKLVQSLKKEFPDDHIGISQNLEETLNGIICDHPSLIITDVFLKDTDCIQLIEETKNIDPKIPIIIYSKHKNIEVAIKAFRLGVFDYVFNIGNGSYTKNIFQAVRSAYKQWEKNNADYYQSLQEDQAINKIKTYASRQVLNSLIDSHEPVLYLEHVDGILQLGLLGHQTYTAMLIYESCNFDGEKSQNALTLLSIQTILKEWVRTNGIVFPADDHCLAVIVFDVNTDRFVTHEHMISILKKIFDNSFMVCIGSTVDSIDYLYSSFQEAKRIYQSHCLYQQNQVIDFSQKSSLRKCLVFPSHIINQIVSEIQEGKPIHSIDSLSHYLSTSLCLSSESLKIIYFMIVYKTEISKSVDPANFQFQSHSLAERLFEIVTVSDLEREIQLFAQKQLELAMEQNALIQQVVSYLKNHFTETNMTLKSVADQFFVSISYLSTIFKKECGYSFKEYLNQIRIEHAKQLLCESNDSITQIAQKCGYNSIQYFTQVFRKVINLSPTRYRQNISNENKNIPSD